MGVEGEEIFVCEVCCIDLLNFVVRKNDIVE